MSKSEETFEELMNRLEEITNKLEKEQSSLDEAVKLFEEGIEYLLPSHTLMQKCWK